MTPKTYVIRGLSALVATLMLVSCGGSGNEYSSPPLSNSAQVSAMAIDTPNSSAALNVEALDSAVALAKGSGVKGVIVTYTWSDLESEPGQIDVSMLRSALSYYHQKGLQIFLGIQVLNTVKREVPSDLRAVAFDDPNFIARFHRLLDAVQSTLSGGEQYISIGNEVDVYLRSQPTEWATYSVFYNDAVSYIHMHVPGLLVGVTSTFSGYSAGSVAAVHALNTQSDVIVLTYYPLQEDSQVMAPTSPATDLPTMISLANGKPVVLQEAGYPTGSLNGSSPQAQQEFVTSLYHEWRNSGDAMPFLSYFLLYDFDATTCAYLDTYYGVSDPAFSSFLCTLGLRGSDGTAKQAWQTYVDLSQ